MIFLKVIHIFFCRYDPLSSCLVDFKGRANMASVKNFQLIQSYCQDSDAKKSQEMDTEREYILQVGKVRILLFSHFLFILMLFSIIWIVIAFVLSNDDWKKIL